MSKKEFLTGLEEALLENMNISEAAPHIRYYRDYIESEVAKGRTEDEVVAMLQSPRLIAKNIINNSESANKYDNNVNRMLQEENYNKKSREYSNENKTNNGFGFSINGKPVNSLLGKILLAVIIILTLVVVITVVSGLMWLLVNIVLPIIAIIFIIGMVVKWFSTKNRG